MPKMMASDRSCIGVTSGATGNEFSADKKGFIEVNDHRDVVTLKAAGYVVAGGMGKVRKYWTCEPCGRDALINHCTKCESVNLTRVG